MFYFAILFNIYILQYNTLGVASFWLFPLSPEPHLTSIPKSKICPVSEMKLIEMK